MPLLPIIILVAVLAAVIGFFARAYPSHIGANMSAAFTKVFWPALSVAALHCAIALMFPKCLLWVQAHADIYLGIWLMVFVLWAASGHWATKLLSTIAAIVMVAYLISSNLPARFFTFSPKPAPALASPSVTPPATPDTEEIEILAQPDQWSEVIELLRGTRVEINFDDSSVIYLLDADDPHAEPRPIRNQDQLHNIPARIRISSGDLNPVSVRIKRERMDQDSTDCCDPEPYCD